MSNQFKSIVKRILKEEVEKSVTNKEIYKRLPEVGNFDQLRKVSPHPTDKKSKQEILDDITKAVSAINKHYEVIWDDHDDIHVVAEDNFKILISPRFENNYNITTYTNLEDRVYVTGQTLSQVIEFIKENLKNKETNTEKAYNKSIGDKPEGSNKSPQNQKDKPDHKKVGDTSNKNKDFNEDLEKKHPQNTPMEEMGKQKKQDEHPVKGTKPDYKMPKQKNKTLVVKQK